MLAIAAPPRVYGAARTPGRGYQLTYRSGVTCPACGGRQWHVGRSTAQCACCSTALPIAKGGAA